MILIIKINFGKMPKSKLLNFKPYKSFLYIFKHSKKSCISGHSPPSTEVIAPLKNKVKPSTDSTRVIVLPSKTAPTIASISKTAPITASINKTAPTNASKSMKSPPVAPPSEAAVPETSSICVLRETVVSETVTDSNKITQLQPFPMIVTVTILNDNLGCHDKMAPTTATPCAPPDKTRKSSPSKEEKVVNVQ